MGIINSKNIIITGASSGIGKEIAIEIAKRGGIPILLARSTERLQEIKEELKGRYQIECKYYSVDLTNLDAYKQTLEKILAENNRIDAIINNAGFGIFHYVEDSLPKDNEKMFYLNVLALIEGVRLMLPHFVANNYGHVINIGSQAGKFATPKSAVYSATKHAVIGFSNSLRLEVQDKGIFVTTVNIGPVRTNFFTVADPTGNYKNSIERYMLEPHDVAHKVVNALFTAKREINMPRWMYIGSKFYQAFPTLMERLLKKQFYKK